MDWASVAGSIIIALVALIGLPLALRKRKRSSPQKVEQLLSHLQEMGFKVSLTEKGGEEEKVGVSRASGQRSEGVIKVEERNIDFINIVSVASQYGVNYFFNYLARSPSSPVKRHRKKTRLVRKKSSGIRGRVVDIMWKGDDYLSRELNFDYQLKDRLLQTELDKLKGSIWIFPEPKYEYTRIRTPYLLPSPDLLEAIDIIGKHIRSGW